MNIAAVINQNVTDKLLTYDKLTNEDFSFNSKFLKSPRDMYSSTIIFGSSVTTP